MSIPFEFSFLEVAKILNGDRPILMPYYRLGKKNQPGLRKLVYDAGFFNNFGSGLFGDKSTTTYSLYQNSTTKNWYIKVYSLAIFKEICHSHGIIVGNDGSFYAHELPKVIELAINFHLFDRCFAITPQYTRVFSRLQYRISDGRVALD